MWTTDRITSMKEKKYFPLEEAISFLSNRIVAREDKITFGCQSNIQEVLRHLIQSRNLALNWNHSWTH